MAENEDHQIGRQVIGALVRDIFITDRASVDGLQEGAKEFAGAAAGAAVQYATSNRPSEGTFALV